MTLTTKLFTLFLFPFLLIANASCTENNLDKLPPNRIETNLSETSNRLKFTTGIRSIYEDSKGNLWFGSHNEGVAKYDGKIFQYFTTEEGLSNNQVRTIQEDNKSNIWLGTASGTTRYDGNKFTTQNPIEESLSFDAPYGIRTNQAPIKKNNLPVSKGAKSDLWFNAGLKSGAIKYDGNVLTYLPFPKPKHINKNSSYEVTGIAVGKNNITWFATFAAIFGFDGEKFTIVEDESLGLSKEIGELHVRSILEDSKGHLWIGNNGLGVFVKRGDTFIDFTKQHGLVSNKTLRDGSVSPQGTLEHVFVIFEDSQGNIWFADRDTGAWKYDGKSMTNFTKEDGLTTTHIWEIYETKNHELLFGMGDGRVCKFNGITFETVY